MLMHKQIYDGDEMITYDDVKLHTSNSVTKQMYSMNKVNTGHYTSLSVKCSGYTKMYMSKNKTRGKSHKHKHKSNNNWFRQMVQQQMMGRTQFVNVYSYNQHQMTNFLETDGLESPFFNAGP